MFRILTVLLIAALPARATPPDMIYIDETLFGVNDTHVFFLRTVNNNLGLHMYGMTDTYLVAKNVETGMDENIWPILRQHGAPDYDTDGNPFPVIQTFPLKDARNPYAILSELGGILVADGSYHQSDPIPLTADGVRLNEYVLNGPDLEAQMEYSVHITLKSMQPYPREGYVQMTFSTPADLLGNWQVEAQNCEIMDARIVNPVYGMREVPLARLSCWDSTNEQPASFYVVLKPDEQAD